MTSSLHRRGLLRAGLAAGALLALPSARACEFFSDNLRIFHPWTRATSDGDDFAVLCMRFDEVRQDDRLIRVETAVASGAEMAGAGAGLGVDFAIPRGRETVLGESGTYIRLLGLKHRLEVARSYPLRLGFEKGGVVNALLNVDYTSFRFK